jgi:hypothetical protein
VYQYGSTPIALAVDMQIIFCILAIVNRINRIVSQY